MRKCMDGVQGVETGGQVDQRKAGERFMGKDCWIWQLDREDAMNGRPARTELQ